MTTLPLRANWIVGATLAVALAGAWVTAEAQPLDTRLVASGLTAPVFATAPLADGRLFVVEQTGAIKVVQGGTASTFLTVPVAMGGEQGLLGLAFDPGYANPASAGYRRFFVDYIDPANGDTVIASYRTSAGNASQADAGSRTEVLRFEQPDGRTNHKAGWIGFKPGNADHLYIATGDGGSANDPDDNGQNLNTLLGKMLRIDVNRDDFAADPNRNYAIPIDNPFAGQAGARGEIYAYGLRNPFRDSFDRLSGDLWIADVGQGAREEVDLIAAGSTGGQNFGWRVREGDIANPEPGVGGPKTADMVDPVIVYDRSDGNGTVIGGYVVRDASSPLDGRYVFGDYLGGHFYAVAPDATPKTLADATDLTAAINAGQGGAITTLTSFGEGANGELYIVDLGDGTAGSGRVVQVLAVPEPASALLMLVGTAALLARRRRR